jgi:hypothetical protein
LARESLLAAATVFRQDVEPGMDCQISEGNLERVMNLNFDSTAGLWTLAVVQLWGIAIALIARLSQGSSHAGICNTLFLFSLVLMGGATLASLTLQPVNWLFSAITLTTMTMVAVCDFRRSKASEFFTTGL